MDCAQAAAQEREDYEAADDLVARAAALAGEVNKLELASTQLTRELESLSDTRMMLQARQASMWARAAEIMETELLKRRAEYAKHAEALLAQETRVEEALAQQLNQVACQLQHLRFDKEKVAQERELLQDSLDARTSVERAEMEKGRQPERVVGPLARLGGHLAEGLAAELAGEVQRHDGGHDLPPALLSPQVALAAHQHRLGPGRVVLHLLHDATEDADQLHAL